MKLKISLRLARKFYGIGFYKDPLFIWPTCYVICLGIFEICIMDKVRYDET